MTTDEKPDTGQSDIAGTAEVLVPAVTRATRVLEALVRTRSGASLTELAGRCSLAKSTASNLLRTMVAEGLVSYDPETRRYNLGPILVEFGVAAITRTTAVTEARPFMERLAERTELACLAIQPMPDGHFVAIAKIESRKDIKVTIEVGERFDRRAPLVSAAGGGMDGTEPSGAPGHRSRRPGSDPGPRSRRSLRRVPPRAQRRRFPGLRSRRPSVSVHHAGGHGPRSDPRGRRPDVGLPRRSSDLDHDPQRGHRPRWLSESRSSGSPDRLNTPHRIRRDHVAPAAFATPRTGVREVMNARKIAVIGGTGPHGPGPRTVAGRRWSYRRPRVALCGPRERGGQGGSGPDRRERLLGGQRDRRHRGGRRARRRAVGRPPGTG